MIMNVQWANVNTFKVDRSNSKSFNSAIIKILIFKSVFCFGNVSSKRFYELLVYRCSYRFPAE